jgi:hypothetical protein
VNVPVSYCPTPNKRSSLVTPDAGLKAASTIDAVNDDANDAVTVMPDWGDVKLLCAAPPLKAA